VQYSASAAKTLREFGGIRLDLNAGSSAPYDDPDAGGSCATLTSSAISVRISPATLPGGTECHRPRRPNKLLNPWQTAAKLAAHAAWAPKAVSRSGSNRCRGTRSSRSVPSFRGHRYHQDRTVVRDRCIRGAAHQSDDEAGGMMPARSGQVLRPRATRYCADSAACERWRIAAGNALAGRGGRG
jgi:hypothetical protein